MPILPPPPRLRCPSYDPVIQIGPERPPLVPPRRLFVSGAPLGSIQVSYRHGLPGQRVRVLAPAEVRPVLPGFTSARATPPLRPPGALLAGGGPVLGRCVPAEPPPLQDA